MTRKPPEAGEKDAAWDEQIQLRRLRRRAVKLGTLGMRIEKPGVRLYGTERRLDASYWLIDNSTNGAVCPLHASGCATLNDIEAAVAREEEKERAGK